jgi:hypothetical protein
LDKQMMSFLLVFLLIFSVPVLLVYGLTKMEVIETPFIISGYQGLQPSFEAIYWNGYWYDTFNTGPNPNYLNPATGTVYTPSSVKFGEYCVLNPDDDNSLLPSLKMSGTQILVDPNNWKSDTYTWEIYKPEESTDVVDVYETFQIQKILAEWKVNVWIDGTGNEAYPDDNHRWHDARIWIKLTPQNFVYFEDNPEELYFAPAYIGVSNIEWYSGKEDPNQTKDPTQAAKNDLYPEQVGDSFAIYAAKGETSEYMDETVILSYQGVELDPAIFKDEYWIRMNVDRMQADSQLAGIGGWDWSYVSAHITFEVHLFVVGKWRVVLEKGDVPDLEPREVYFGTDPFADLLRAVAEFATSPTGILLAIIALVTAIVIALALTGALPSVISLLTIYGQRKKGGG